MGAACCCCLADALPSSNEYLQSNDYVQVEFDDEDNIVFEPLKAQRKSVGVIIYPGAKADPRGYSQIATALARNGYFVVIVRLTCYLASFSPNKALGICEKYSTKAQKWTIGGHSLGGIFSSKFLKDNAKNGGGANKKDFVGLFLWGSRGYNKHDISDLPIKTLILYSDLDGLIKREWVEESVAFLPKGTSLKLLKGGNHAYFGHFPVFNLICLRDNEAEITLEQQQQFVIKEMLDFLAQL